ncbi:MAG: chloride channel protein, partial [Porphyromonas sp.]|nr:chloride channel protein [Porphyromonas sp.]
MDREERGWIYKLLIWREKHIPENIFVGILAFVIGVLCSLSSLVLKSAIHFIQKGGADLVTFRGLDFGHLIFPIIGVLLSGLFVIYIVRDDISHGVTKILFSISQRKSRIKPHNIWSSIVASSITIGLGGSVGAESPIVLTGSAIGSNIGRLFRLEHRNLMLLVGCGAAGAVAGIFKAPITGLLFVIEVLLMDLTLTTVMPLLISSVTAASLSYVIFGTEAMFPYLALEPFTLNRIPFVILLGVCCGLVSLYFTKISFSLEQQIKKLPKYMQRFLISAVVLSALIFLFPPLYGEGYTAISSLIEGNTQELMRGSIFSLSSSKGISITLLFLTLTLLTKVFATVATNAGGGCGGVFAPSLFNGALVGFIFSCAV